MQKEAFKKIHIQLLQSYNLPEPKRMDGHRLWNDFGDKNLLTYEQTCPAHQQAQFDNGFFAAFLYAYNYHCDVKISPDDVWIVIMLYFSKYVNDHPQELRKAFVSHEGKEKLTVTTYKQLSQSQWDQFFTLMIEEIKKKTTKGAVQKFQSSFSTTGRIQKLISTATIMNTLQQYFSYGRCIPMCGIQNVHFGGTLQDWKLLSEKVQMLKEYDVDGKLKQYIEKVGYIIEKFIQTYRAMDIDVDFWNKIINSEKGRLGSGSTTYYSGWLIHLFGYYEKVQAVRLQSIGFDIEIDNKLTGIKKTVRLVGGFRAISREGRVVRPHLSFAIQDGKPLKN